MSLDELIAMDPGCDANESSMQPPAKRPRIGDSSS
jgi:hypothetical protein